jgi:NDP-sugar pyrophosphorylase family protein
MLPLTKDTPKPLIQVAGKAIIDYIVEALPPEIDELVIVVGYLREQIQLHCGTEFHGRPVTYVVQENPAGGTGDALAACESILTGRFLFMYADDIHGKEALQEVVNHKYAMLAAHSDTPEKFGVLQLHADGTLAAIIEKPTYPPSNFINIGGIVLDNTIFSYDIPMSPIGELLVTDMVTAFALEHSLKIIEQPLWLPIGYPDDIEKAERVLAQLPKTAIEASAKM